MMTIHKHKANQGQTLVEIIIGLTIAAIIATGMVKVTTISVKNTSFSRDQSQAVSIAQKKMAQAVVAAKADPGFWAVANVGLATLPVGVIGNEIVESYCLNITTSEKSSGMAKIQVKILWGAVGASTCPLNATNYSHNLVYETYVTQ